MANKDEEITQGVRLITDILSQMVEAEAPTKPRKAVQRAEGRTGRSAFVAPVCAEHPDWESESGVVTVAFDPANPPAERDPELTYVEHCAKFGHLPGKGKGVWQPPFWRVLVNISAEMVKPTIIIGALFLALFGLKFVMAGGFGTIHVPVLQPRNGVHATACPMPDSSEHASARAIPRPSGSTAAGHDVGKPGVSRGQAVKC